MTSAWSPLTFDSDATMPLLDLANQSLLSPRHDHSRQESDCELKLSL